MTTIAFEDLTKNFGQKKAVDGLSFTVEPGRITGFLGPNGAGKTTTLRMLLGLVEPTSGRATLDGKTYRELSHPRRQVGAVLEASGIHPGRSGKNHLRIIQKAAGIPASRVDQMLELVDLREAADIRAGKYSLGMRQRLALAAAMLGDPEVLVLDEPANGLDPAGIHWLRDFLRSGADEGRTIIVSSHLLAEMEQTADEVVIIGDGRLLRKAQLSEMAKDGPSLEETFLELTIQ
ncbi:MAG: ABC transporter ATP-binding protein [Actinobacteria bacterium]|nr:ABC transporter ATP-binding protein [Actinomycetota bacterium]